MAAGDDYLIDARALRWVGPDCWRDMGMEPGPFSAAFSQWVRVVSPNAISIPDEWIKRQITAARSLYHARQRALELGLVRFGSLARLCSCGWESDEAR